MIRPEPYSSSPLPAEPETLADSSVRVAALLETYLARAQQELRRGAARNRYVRQARAFLRQRGVASGQWQRLPLGVLPETAEMEAALREAGFLSEEIEASRLLADPRLPGRLVGPIRTVDGQLASFWARHPAGQPPKYLVKGAWREELAVAGLDAAGPALAEADGDLLVIGDLLDAVLLQYHGFRSVAALAGTVAQITARRWERLAELGISRVTLAFLGPNVRDELLAALEASWAARRSPQIAVLLPERFQDATTWSEWLRLHGIEAFGEALLASRIHAYRYCALVLLERHQGAGPWTEATRQAAWLAAHGFYETHTGGPRTRELDTYFVPYIVEALQCDWEPPQPEEGSGHSERSEESGQPSVATEILRSAQDDRCAQDDDQLPEPAQPEPEPLRSLAVELADWASLGGTPRRGLRQRSLPGLDRVTGGLHGVVLVAGPTRLARSALALQLATEAVRRQRDACLLMVSRRWSSTEILTRLLARRARMAWKRLRRPATLSESAALRLQRAEAELGDWGRRVLVLDRARCTAPTLDGVVDAWTRLQEETETSRGLLLIDDPSGWDAGGRPSELLRRLADRTGAEAVLATVGTEPGSLGDEADLSLALRFLPARVPQRGRVPSKLLVSDAQEVAPLGEFDLTFHPQSWGFREGPPQRPAIAEPAPEPFQHARQASDYCPLHRCPALECFCFD